MIALAWIKAPSNKWKTFVANRTAEIQNLTSSNWNHVSSGDNPADAISRGLAPNMLLKTNIWWTGPTWLMNDCKHWPKNAINLNDIPETKETTVSLVTTNTSFHLFEKYSNLIRLMRVTAYCLRFIRKVKLHRSTQPIINSELKHIPLLTASEIEDAKMILLKTSQRQSFAQKIQCLNKEKPISNNSAIQGLNPFIDKGEFLRLGGRLSNSQLPYEEKFPLILSSKHPFTKLLIEYEHKRLLHAGTQAVMMSLRRLYWPTQCRTTVKHIIRKCVRCFRAKPTTQEHLMGDLPASRVTCQRPFHTCGVDYAGPFLLKDRTRSKVTTKAYLCVFVCFTTKAVHLELAANLTTEAFLNCLRRFIARRGNCHSIYSDNGTNFIGARNELNELGILMTNDTFKTTISDHLSTRQIQWHLIPPHAPHFGGLWESAVKSVKYHLKRTIRDAKLTYEELYTLLTQIESCMNSRPLCPLSDDPTDLNPLTPGHFLIGDSLTALPHPDLQHINVNRLNRYQHIQQMLQHFWKRWHQEYFHQLQQRTKWRAKTCPSFGPGTLVLIKEDNAPPLKWKMGRITEVYPGKDNIVRVVSVRTWDGILKRPLTKICILPIADNLDKEIIRDGKNIPKDRGEEPLTKS
ncbi:uncharacterized protein LOC143211125 [Lasioglossum baleicum]|uniref:uncharacterized protein LOC143211125 n=1 Tax=Lasioglossum baleicum TaxID=434251 RepID=UPI003FCE7163